MRPLIKVSTSKLYRAYVAFPGLDHRYLKNTAVPGPRGREERIVLRYLHFIAYTKYPFGVYSFSS